MPIFPFHKPRVTDPDPKLPINRRMVWEHFADVRIVNTWLLLFSCLSLIALIVMGSMCYKLAMRPPYVLSEDQGTIMWRTTEVFRLREDNVKMFHDLVLGKLLNSNPSYYDITPLTPMVHPLILSKFSKNDANSSGVKLRSDKRQVYSLYDVRRTSDPRYPQYLAFITRGETTVYEERRDAAGNVKVYPQSEISVWVTFLAPTKPTPTNPWAFRMVGLEHKTGATADQAWAAGKPVAGSMLPDGTEIQPEKLPEVAPSGKIKPAPRKR